MGLRRCVIEQEAGFTGKGRDIKSIFHDEENIHIIWEERVRDKRPKHHEVGKMPCGPCDAVDALKALCNASPLGESRPKRSNASASVTP